MSAAKGADQDTSGLYLSEAKASAKVKAVDGGRFQSLVEIVAGPEAWDRWVSFIIPKPMKFEQMDTPSNQRRILASKVLISKNIRQRISSWRDKIPRLEWHLGIWIR